MRKSYSDNAEYGLFIQLFTTSMMKGILTWTNHGIINDINSAGMKAVTKAELLAYFGMEMAMSIVQMNDIKFSAIKTSSM